MAVLFTTRLAPIVPAEGYAGGARLHKTDCAPSEKVFEELMAALASDDGREVVLALEALREEGALERSIPAAIA